MASFGGSGVVLGGASRVDDLNVASCGDGGIVLGPHSLAFRNVPVRGGVWCIEQ